MTLHLTFTLLNRWHFAKLKIAAENYSDTFSIVTRSICAQYCCLSRRGSRGNSLYIHDWSEAPPTRSVGTNSSCHATWSCFPSPIETSFKLENILKHKYLHYFWIWCCILVNIHLQCRENILKSYEHKSDR